MTAGLPKFFAGKLSRGAVELLREMFKVGAVTVPRLTGHPFELMALKLITAPMAADFNQKRGYRIDITDLGWTVANAMVEAELAHG